MHSTYALEKCSHCYVTAQVGWNAVNVYLRLPEWLAHGLRNGAVVKAEWVCELCAGWDFSATILWSPWNKAGAERKHVYVPGG